MRNLSKTETDTTMHNFFKNKYHAVKLDSDWLLDNLATAAEQMCRRGEYFSTLPEG